MNSQHSSFLWLVSLAGGLALANSSTVHAPCNVAEVLPAMQLFVPQDHYLDLGCTRRTASSASYTAVLPLACEPQPGESSPGGTSIDSAARVDLEHRYIDIHRARPATALPTTAPSLLEDPLADG